MGLNGNQMWLIVNHLGKYLTTNYKRVTGKELDPNVVWHNGVDMENTKKIKDAWVEYGLSFGCDETNYTDDKMLDRILRWFVLDEGKVSAKEAEDWEKAGFPPYLAEHWVAVKFSPNEDAVKFSPDEAKAWKFHFFAPEEAVKWKKAGFTPEEAPKWSKKFSSETAVTCAKWKTAGWGKSPMSLALAFEYKTLFCQADTAATIAKKTKYISPRKFSYGARGADKKKIHLSDDELRKLFEACNGKDEATIAETLSKIIQCINQKVTKRESLLESQEEVDWTIRIGFKKKDLDNLKKNSAKLNNLRNLSIARFFVLPKSDTKRIKDKVSVAGIYAWLEGKNFIQNKNRRPDWAIAETNIKNFYKCLEKAAEDKNGKTHAAATKILQLWTKPYKKNNDKNEENNNKAVKKYLEAFLKNCPKQEIKKAQE